MRHLATAALAAILTLGVISPATAAKKTTLKFATLAPDGSAWDKLLKQMGSEWQTETDGRVKVRIYPGGVAGDDPDVVRKMRIGQLQGAALTVAGLTSIDEVFNVFSIPLFFDSIDEFLYVRGKLTPLIRERVEAKGFKFVNWGHGGWIHVFSTRPITSVNDMNNIKFFTWAGDDRMAQVYSSVGFSPVPLAVTDIMTGLETGLIEAMPTTPFAALALQWYRQVPYMVGLGLAPLVGGNVVSLKAWEKLSPQDQQVILTSSQASEDALTHDIQVGDVEAIEAMKEKGLTVLEVDRNDPGWTNTAARFATEMQKELVPADVFDLAVKYRAEFRAGNASGGGSR